MTIKLFVATKAFIKYNDKILILRESTKYKDGTNSGKFDVVGGRIQPGERFEESLMREVKEETCLEVEIGKPFFVNEARPTINGEECQIIRIFFECTSNSDKIILSEDHDKFEWINPQEYQNHNIIPNLKPAFEAYNQ